MVENLYESKIKIIRTDNGGEYTSNNFENYLKNEGIVHQTTVVKTPEQNGIAERKNRSLVEKVRCLIFDSKLPKTFWAEAISTVNYVLNRSPSAVVPKSTPYEKLNNIKPNVAHFRVFGCDCYAHIPKDKRSKLDFKSNKCIFLRYSNVKKGYRLYDVANKKVIFSRDVIFDEVPNLSKNDAPVDIPIDNSLPNSYNSDESDTEEFVDCLDQVSPRRSERIRRTPERYGEWCYFSRLESDEPRLAEEALNCPESDKWFSAMKSEIDSIHHNNVWTLVERKNNYKVINSKWIFRKKIDADKSISYKARLVAQGFSQRPGIDYSETFSPVVRFEAIRAILFISAKFNLKIHQMDVSSAFLNSDLSEKVYLKQPEFFVKKGHENTVCLLKKSIYGLKQSSKCWNDSYSSFIVGLGFKQLDCDSCIFVTTMDCKICIIALYVDDLLISCDSNSFIEQLKSKLMLKYKMKDLGLSRKFLGVNFVQNNDEIFIHQTDFTSTLLEKFQFLDCKPVSTPVDNSIKLMISTDGDKLFDVNIYQSAVGALLYLATRTRPDISYAVSTVDKFSSKPNITHWSAVKRIFRYLKGNMDLGITYEKNEIDKCLRHCDADFAGDFSDRKSTSGFCFSLGSGLVSWKSCKQSCVALSTAEAEYVSLSLAAQEAMWLRKLLLDLNFCNDEPILIFEDNQSTICLAKSNRNHSRSKHIDVKFNFIRDVINDRKILVEYCPTNDMVADIFTKGLSAERFNKLRSMLGMRNFHNSN